MTIYIILACIVIVLIILSLYGWIWHEDFEDVATISPELQEKYDKFKAFYDDFMINWTKAVATSLTTRLPPPEPATDPSIDETATAKSPSNDELNQHVTELTQELKVPLPFVTGPLPPTLSKKEVIGMVKIKSIDPAPFHNALKWMNTNMDASHAALDNALSGGTVDGFEDICQQITQCTEQQEQDQLVKEEQLGKMLDAFTENQQIKSSSKRNKELTAKSKEIQAQAQSGALINKLNISSDEPEQKFHAPAGSNLWKKMKEEDPEKAQNIKQSMKSVVGMKEWADNINSNLR